MNYSKDKKYNSYDFVVWDWNGTLYDDVSAGIETINSMLIERKIPPLDLERYRQIFGFPIKEYYVRAGFDFSNEPYEDLAAIFIERNNARLGKSGLYKNAIQTLEHIKNKNIRQVVLSATRRDILLQQIGLFEINDYFCQILGNLDFYAYGKTQLAADWIHAHGLHPQRILLIGDTTHDFEVSKQVGCDCILIANGHQSKTRLLATGAKILDSINDITNEISKPNQ